MSVQNHISVEGFVADPDHPSGLRFPAIEAAAARVFASEPVRSLTIRNTMSKGEAELYVVAGDGVRHHTLFDFDGLATAAAIEQERWWEDAIRSAWERIKP